MNKIPIDDLLSYDKDSVIYDLYAVTNHHGGLHGGHYTAYGYSWKNKKWYKYDDSDVTELGQAETPITKEAYVLYYKRRNVPVI